MTQQTGLSQFDLPSGAWHMELAFVNYDQWILTISLRVYDGSRQEVAGVIHVVFENADGFRVLDESLMLQFPWASLSPSQSFVHRVGEGGWLEMGRAAGDMVLVMEGAQEYVIVTDNECVSVIAYDDPIVIKSLDME